MTEPLIFEASRPGRSASAQFTRRDGIHAKPDKYLRGDPPLLPEVSELDVVRHFTR